jgi:hypothetical protein
MLIGLVLPLLLLAFELLLAGHHLRLLGFSPLTAPSAIPAPAAVPIAGRKADIAVNPLAFPPALETADAPTDVIIDAFVRSNAVFLYFFILSPLYEYDFILPALRMLLC